MYPNLAVCTMLPLPSLLVLAYTYILTHIPSLPGSGWTTKETVRSLAYSILADLVHHIRTSLSLQHLSMAVFLFSKNVHDETLPVSIQTMSCKLLLNLVECIRQKAETEPAVSGHIYEFVLLFKVKISLLLAVECECLHPY